MTLAKKNSRRIVVREKTFRWKLNAMFEPEWGFVVEPEDASMGCLIVQVGLGHDITPRIVAACVERALSSPWGGSEREVLMACPPELLRGRSDTGPRVLTSLHHPVERSGSGVT